VDPIGCILISLVIVHRWLDIMRDQMEKVVGDSASPEFIAMIKELVMQCDVKDQGGGDGVDGGEALLLGVDRVIAYHSGSRYNVEVDLLLPRLATVEASHAIGLRVQQRIEELPDVERANIHVWIDEWMDGCMHGWMYGYIDG
jgi:divalent metal cation (Fe/Co/Zn/Cd) transporter